MSSCEKHKTILTVHNYDDLPEELKKFINNPVKTCPFCGSKPHKDVMEFGAKEEDFEKIKEEDEYKNNPDYGKIMNEYFKANQFHAEFRITCINDDCLGVSTGFQDSAEKAEKMWDTRF